MQKAKQTQGGDREGELDGLGGLEVDGHAAFLGRQRAARLFLVQLLEHEVILRLRKAVGFIKDIA